MDLNPEKEITVPANNSLKTSVWVNGKDTRCFSGQCIEEFKLPTIPDGDIIYIIPPSRDLTVSGQELISNPDELKNKNPEDN
jgi:hypothetical protein